MAKGGYIPPTPLSEVKEQMKRVLTNYVRLGVIGLACDEAGVRRKTHTEWLTNYPAYADKFYDLKERYVDGFEKVANQRAMSGSDGMLQFMLKAHRREVYGDRTDVALMGKQNAPPVQLIFNESILTEEEKKILGGGAYADKKEE